LTQVIPPVLCPQSCGIIFAPVLSPTLPDGLGLLDGGPFRELRYETADLFLHDLSPHGRLFGPNEPLGNLRWLFRGVKDSSFKLVPSAFRELGTARLFATPPKMWSHLIGDADLPELPERQRNRHQYEAERRVLLAFFHAADLYGLPLPEDSQRLRKTLEREPDKNWPPVDLLSLLALAQHYGCPTRLLDWSPRSPVAAWFAASGALGFKERERPEFPPSRTDTGDNRLLVWALCEYELTLEKKLLDATRYEIEVVSAPHAGNENLHAQHGVFTLTRDHKAFLDRRPDLSALDVLLWRRHCSEKMFPQHATVIRLTLPWSQARRLLTLLARSGICSAALFPGYSGVADALWESRLLMSAAELESTRPSDEQLHADPRCLPPSRDADDRAIRPRKTRPAQARRMRTTR